MADDLQLVEVPRASSSHKRDLDCRFRELIEEADQLADEPIHAPARETVPAYALEAEQFIAAALAERGDSHGAGHARIVRDSALAILAQLAALPDGVDAEAPATAAASPAAAPADDADDADDAEATREARAASDRKVVELAALLHDVCDHKYCEPTTASGQRAIAARDACLRALASADEAALVLAIVDGVSFSKEAKGQLDRAAMSARLRRLRDVVSDADKLEAIGAVGLRRCLDYRRERDGADAAEAVARDVAAHCDVKLLRLASSYVRTAPGRALAAPRHRALARWRARFADAVHEAPTVTVVMTVRNCQPWLEAALRSVGAQTHRPLELALVDDGSTDGTWAVLERLRPELEAAGVRVVAATRGAQPRGRGIGYGQNRAVAHSAGVFLCFLDGDDVAAPTRAAKQLALALEHEAGDAVLVGCGFSREPADATPRYTAWANGLSEPQLLTHCLRELTVIHPTWFCARALYERLGGLNEGGAGYPEDLDFFYRHLRAGGRLARVAEPLVVWRHAPTGVTASRGVPWQTIWEFRMRHLEATVLGTAAWAGGFCIWGAGKEGKRLYRSLSAESRARVRQFCDLDPKKLALGAYTHKESGARVPIVHFREATPPLLLCVKDFDGAFLANVRSLGLTEGEQYLHFSF